MKGSDWAAVIIGFISLLSAISAGRAARTAAKYNADSSMINSRTQAETEAYNRARKMDVETIERQDKEIEELIDDNKKLHDRCKELERRQEEDRRLIREQQEEIQHLKQRIAGLSREGNPHG